MKNTVKLIGEALQSHSICKCKKWINKKLKPHKTNTGAVKAWGQFWGSECYKKL